MLDRGDTPGGPRNGTVAQARMCDLAAALRQRALASTDGADASPEGLTPGLAGFLAGLWSEALRYDAADPDWPDRDRFVLSDATLAPFLHALHALVGVAETRDEAIVGLPGQGVAAGIGIALGERACASRFGRSLVDHRTWVLASAEELSAGLVHEAASLAGDLRLDRLAIVFQAPAGATAPDRDETEMLRRFTACGWTVRTIDGTDAAAVASCLASVNRARKPSLIVLLPSPADAAQGAPQCEGGTTDAAHAAWRAIGRGSATDRRAWLKRLSAHPLRAAFERAHGRASHATRTRATARGDTADAAGSTLAATLAALAAAGTDAEDSTTASGGSARLLHLSSTRASGAFAHLPPLSHARYDGRHLDCQGREHGMTMLAHGLALHGGILPVCAAPTVAADRLRPAIRLAALTGRRIVLLLTEDGLSHGRTNPVLQPVEQIASLRAIPGLWVFRPADAAEAAEALDLALARADGPSVILLSAEQAHPYSHRHAQAAPATANPVARGGYVAAEAASGRRGATLVATGPELGRALEARAILARRGIDVAVVSLPCWELFARQTAGWRAQILGIAPRFGIEAATGFGWERWLGDDGRFIGLADFGTGLDAEAWRDAAGLSGAGIASIVAASSPRLAARPYLVPRGPIVL